MITARQMLTWLDGRNGSSFQPRLRGAATSCRSTIAVETGANGLHALVPSTAGSSPITSVSLNGSVVPFTTQTIKGVQYAMFLATAGNYAATYTPPPPAAPAGLRSTVVQGAPATTPTLFEARFAPLAAAAQDSAAPVVSSVNARPLPDGTVEVTWGTDENADATLQYGQQPDKLADLHDDTVGCRAHRGGDRSCSPDRPTTTG